MLRSKLYRKLQLLSNFALDTAQIRQKSDQVANSMNFYLRAVNRQISAKVTQQSLIMLKQDSRPYYSDFFAQEFPEDSANSHITKFVTDCMLSLQKH